MSDTRPIGLMDWGIGGFSVYAALRAAGRTEDVIYFSDAGNISYGRLTTEQMRSRFLEIARFYRGHGVRDVLVGCNAASSALADDVEEIEGVRFYSIIPAGVSAAKASGKARIGVIGGELTIASNVYQRRLTGPRYAFAATQPLSGEVERGAFESQICCDEIHDAMHRFNHPDSLLLACTHYPALAALLHRLYPSVELLDPALHLTKAIVPSHGRSSLTFFTTGDVGAAAIARKAFGIQVPEPIRLDMALSNPVSGRAA